MMTMTEAEAASSPPVIHAAADGREPRRRESRYQARLPPATAPAADGHDSAATEPAVADAPASS
jgi:hypothetical protein